MIYLYFILKMFKYPDECGKWEIHTEKNDPVQKVDVYPFEY